MSEAISQLRLQFLTWVAAKPRTYANAMDAWRTSCPRLSVWEDALGDGLVQVEHAGRSDQNRVLLTPRGYAVLNGQAIETLTEPRAS